MEIKYLPSFVENYEFIVAVTNGSDNYEYYGVYTIEWQAEVDATRYKKEHPEEKAIIIHNVRI